VLFIVVPAAVLALLLHPALNGNWYTDVAWTLALYVEAVAILPQLLMFQKSREKEIELFTANFVFFTAVARSLHFFFWLSSYHELNDKAASYWGSRYPGQIVLLSQIVNLLVMVCGWRRRAAGLAPGGPHPIPSMPPIAAGRLRLLLPVFCTKRSPCPASDVSVTRLFVVK
jgi:ER lumen protein retaining receptor